VYTRYDSLTTDGIPYSCLSFCASDGADVEAVLTDILIEMEDIHGGHNALTLAAELRQSTFWSVIPEDPPLRRVLQAIADRTTLRGQHITIGAKQPVHYLRHVIYTLI
jgi:hypothetical protein